MKSKLSLSLIIILAVVHLSLVIPVITHPERFRLADSNQYIDLANNLLKKGTFIGQDTSGIDLLRTPGYPAFLALTLLVFGDVRWVALLQVMLVFMNCFLLYRIASDLKCTRVGFAAVIIYLLSLTVAFEALMIMSETITAFWLLLALWALVRFWLIDKTRWLFLSGLSLGFGTLTRPIVAPLFYAWIILLFILWGWRQRKFQIFRRDLKNLLIFGIAGMFLILAWQGRNLIVHHQFTLSNVAGVNLANYVFAIPIEDVNHISLEQAKTLIASSPNQNAYILAFIKAHPVPFLKSQVRGIVISLISVSYPSWSYELTGNRPPSTGIVTNLSLNLAQLFTQLGSGNSWILVGLAAVLYDLGLFGLAIFATWKILKQQRNHPVFKLVILALLTVAYMVVIPLASGEGRFRIPVEPYLALLAGLAFYAPDRQVS